MKRPKKTAAWFIQQRPCPGADPADLERLVTFTIQRMLTDFALGYHDWAKDCGVGLKRIDDPGLPKGQIPPLLDRFGGIDRLGGMGDADSPDPSSER